MGNTDNKKKKAKAIGAIALSAVLASGVGYGTYNAIMKESPNEGKLKVEDKKDTDVHSDKNDKKDSILFSKGNTDKGKKERDFSHLEEVAIKEAEEQKGIVRGRNLDHLEEIALKHAEETKMNINYTKDDKGRLAFETSDNKNDGLVASIDLDKPKNETEDYKEEKNDDIKPVEPGATPNIEQPITPEPEKPDDSEQLEKPEVPIEPIPEPDPTPEPETPEKPSPEPTPGPEQPEDPEPENPVITTDVIYKTDFIPYKTVEIEEPTLEKGEVRIVQKGKSGERVTKFKVTYKDGKEVKREVLEKNEITPTNEIVLVGIKNLDNLRGILEKVKTLESNNYTEETWNILLEKIAYAESILNDKDSTQKQVDDAKHQLEEAYNNLELAVDYSNLESLISEAESLNEELYSEETWNVLLESLSNAKNILNDEDGTQEQVDFALSQLENAISNLVEVDNEDVESEEEKDEQDELEDNDTNDDLTDGEGHAKGDEVPKNE